LSVSMGRSVALDGGARGVWELTALDEARDGAALGGRTLVATSGGLLGYRAGMRAGARPWTQLDGLAGVDLTAAAPLGERVLVGRWATARARCTASAAPRWSSWRRRRTRR